MGGGGLRAAPAGLSLEQTGRQRGRPGAPASFGSRRRRRNEAISTAAMFYPAFALVAAISFFPLFYAVRQSLHRADYLELGGFVGLRNFVTLFATGGGLHFLSVSLLFVAGTLDGSAAWHGTGPAADPANSLSLRVPSCS